MSFTFPYITYTEPSFQHRSFHLYNYAQDPKQRHHFFLDPLIQTIQHTYTKHFMGYITISENTMHASQERPFIQLPPLPNTEPDECIHTTIWHYHYESRGIIRPCTHDLHPDGGYLNPKYTIPGTSQGWTGAEDSPLLEQMPHTEPPGIGVLDSIGIKTAWHEIARRMTQESRARNISRRNYTETSCRIRHKLILNQIRNRIGGNRGPDGHRGVNPYGVLIPSGYALHMPVYLGLNRKLVVIDFEQDQANPLKKQVSLPRIRSIVGVGKWVTPDEGIGHAGPSSKADDDH